MSSYVVSEVVFEKSENWGSRQLSSSPQQRSRCPASRRRSRARRAPRPASEPTAGSRRATTAPPSASSPVAGRRSTAVSASARTWMRGTRSSGQARGAHAGGSQGPRQAGAWRRRQGLVPHLPGPSWRGAALHPPCAHAFHPGCVEGLGRDCGSTGSSWRVRCAARSCRWSQSRCRRRHASSIPLFLVA